MHDRTSAAKYFRLILLHRRNNYHLLPVHHLREYCFSIIKGKQTPLDFKFILSLPEEGIASLISENSLDFRPADVQGLYLNFRYDGMNLTCITGTSFKSFSMDKSLEQTWDKSVQNFFTDKVIDWDLSS